MRLIGSYLVVCQCGLTLVAGVVNAGYAKPTGRAESAEIFSGSYDVVGTNRDGSKYTRMAVIAISSDKVEMSWPISSRQTYHGTETIKNGLMIVDFGWRHSIFHEVTQDGSLLGKWDNGRASETPMAK